MLNKNNIYKQKYFKYKNKYLELKNNLSGSATMHSSMSFSIIHLRISLSPEPASPVNIGEPFKTIP